MTTLSEHYLERLIKQKNLLTAFVTRYLAENVHDDTTSVRQIRMIASRLNHLADDMEDKVADIREQEGLMNELHDNWTDPESIALLRDLREFAAQVKERSDSSLVVKLRELEGRIEKLEVSVKESEKEIVKKHCDREYDRDRAMREGSLSDENL